MKYERLTQWVNGGASLILDNPKTELEAKQQLMEKYKKACIKLAEYEDLEEQGLILRKYFIKEDKMPNGKTWYNVCRIDTSSYVIERQCGTREAAEKRLKELQK